MVSFRSLPSGGAITIAETGQTVRDGDTVNLPNGRYNASATMEGYRSGQVVVESDGATAQAVEVRLGSGFGMIAVSTIPDAAIISADGAIKGNAPQSWEADEGTHTIRAEAAGYLPKSQAVNVAPGSNNEIVLALEKLQTQAMVEAHSDPDGGRIHFGEQDLGEGPVSIGPLEFGEHTLSAVKETSLLTRLVGTAKITLDTPEQQTVVIPLQSRERLYENAWMAEADALAKEESRYRSQAISNPIEGQIVLDDSALQEIRGEKDLVSSLMAILRIGDRIVFERNGKQWSIWKRHGEVTPEFQMSVDALRTGQAFSLPWSDRGKRKTVRMNGRTGTIMQIALTLHRARSECALLDLPGSLLGKDTVTVQRNHQDGPLTLLAIGGEEVAVSGVRSHALLEGMISDMPAASHPFSVTWKAKPERLLVMSDRQTPVKAEMKSESLRSREKKIVPLATGVTVAQLTRYTIGPDFESPDRKEIRREGPLASQIDLSKDEIGPHERRGTYRRIWVVEYDGGSGRTQRQTEAVYEILDERKEAASDKFLRKEGLKEEDRPELPVVIEN